LKPSTLYITFDGLSDPLGQSQILPYLTGLSKDYDITILSCEKPNRLRNNEFRIKQHLYNSSISWNYNIYNEKGGFLSRLNNVYKTYSLAKILYHSKKFSLVHARSYLAALVALFLYKKFTIPFIFDMRGFWADERIDGNIWNKKKPLHYLFFKFFKRKEKEFLKSATSIVFLTKASLNHAEENIYPGISAKSIVIPCCADVSHFNQYTVSPKNICGIQDTDHVLIYTGSIGTWYFTKEMIDCFKIWKEEMPELKLLIITPDIKEASKILSQYPVSLSDSIIVESASFAEVPAYLARANASIFFIKPAFSKIASSPTKMAECWAMNLPIITNSGIGDNDFYFKQKKGGVLIDNFTEVDYRKALNDYLTLTSSKQNFRDIAVTYFNTEDAVSAYKNIYKNILK
jgi:glycosyltransferase involved in cell wall biosynthesis